LRENITNDPTVRFFVDVRKRLRSIWSQANQLGNEDQTDKAAKYHKWAAVPLRSVTVDGPPFPLPRYLHLDLGKQTQRNVARFRLYSHALRVETRSWEHHDGSCDKCGLQAIQDEKHALFLNSQTTWLKVQVKPALACKCVL